MNKPHAVTARDLKLSRKLKRIAAKVSRMIENEMGEPMGMGIVIFPWASSEEARAAGETAEYQYTSNAPRHHMHEVMRNLVKKWDSGGPDIAPHEKQ
jgi:hypothetical protein